MDRCYSDLHNFLNHEKNLNITIFASPVTRYEDIPVCIVFPI